jgi:imidazolonepropionase-like amidohydrolase
VTEVAHGRGKLVAAHAAPADVIRQAIECGVDSIEHAYFLTPEVAREMVEHRTWLVPTIGVSRAREFFERDGAPGWFIEKALGEAGDAHWNALKAAIQAGVRIAMGTDMLPAEPINGTSASVHEIALMVEAGMTPMAALRAATIDAAELLGAGDELGAIERGRLADLIVVAGDPTTDISALRQLQLVIQGGAIVCDRRPARVASTAGAGD